jgi:ethylmalonyl-CoA mutase
MTKDAPWLFRTYAGHSTATASNALYRGNLAKGQTGLSVAFDLPTQTGYDSDDPRSRGEVGKVGVPVAHLGDMRALFADIPLEKMNTSMTINATAPWLLALYIAVAEEQGADVAALQGTVQNDIIKEYLSRGTYILPPQPSLRLITDVAAYTGKHLPKWNPMNVCSYHLQEAGATPEQELAFALATACAVLDDLKVKVSAADFPAMAGRMSFFVNAGIRFVTELCKMRAFTDLWDTLLETRYGITDAKFRRFRYGVQVNSLGLTEQQPENNVYRILIEMLAVTLSKNARARAVQLPAWNEALGLPRPFDQQWSLRMQQILAYETDLLEYDDLFDGNPAIDRKVAALKEGALQELAHIDAMGGAVAAIAYMKSRLVEANAERLSRIEPAKPPLSASTSSPPPNPHPCHRRGRHHAGRPGRRGRPMRPPRPVAQPRAIRKRCKRPSLRCARPPRPAKTSCPPRSPAPRPGSPPANGAGRCGLFTANTARPTGVSQNPSNRTEGLEPVRDAVAAVATKLGHPLPPPRQAGP